MLKEGLDVYLPLVDDDAIDAVVKRPDGRFIEIQIKARSKDVVLGDAGRFAAIEHEQRPDYWFVFYSERLDTMWIMSSASFNGGPMGRNGSTPQGCVAIRIMGSDSSGTIMSWVTDRIR